jgi:uncharacterized membrane protein
MGKGRVEAFSDGVLAVIITIMVLELHPPHGVELSALLELLPTFLTYVLSFIFIGIYWNNHHHMFHAVDQIDGGVMWANSDLLFWLSLVPFGTSWMDESKFATMTVAVYGFILLMCGVAYYILERRLVGLHGPDTALKQALGSDWKANISPVLYIVGIVSAFISPWIACGFYVLVALMWLIPDPRIERELKD